MKAMNRSRKKVTPAELSRDMYGFVVRPQHLQQYREFASIYKEEEAERSERWEKFLRTCSSADEANKDAAAEDNAAVEGSDAEKSEGPDAEKSEGPDAEKVVGKAWSLQRWCDIRPSLESIQQELGKRFKPRRHETTREEVSPTPEEDPKPKTSDEGPNADSDEDEFYDLDKADGPNESSSGGLTASEDEAGGDECPWKEELRFLVHGGVPMALRGELWQAFVNTKARRVEGHYDVLLNQENGKETEMSTEQGYVPVVEKWANQIEKDLPRTFPGHPALDEDGRNALRRLLTAYARHNPDVGYCQAMNFFAALLLLLMPEENAFWTLTGIMDDYFDGYYSEKLLEAQVDQLVFEELARQHFPKLLSHLDKLGVQIPWISGPWFLSIFVNVLPWESVLRVWDVLLFEGSRSMLFRTALALMEIHAPAVMATQDAGDAISLMQTMAGSTFDSSQLVLTACMGFQTTDEKKLEELRVKHRPIVLATLHERALELRLWRSSQGVLAKKLSRKYTAKTTEALPTENGVHPIPEEPENGILIDEEDDFEEVRDDSDLYEQIIWLKNELCLALEEKRRATARAEELDVALMEIVKEDNRRELSAKVETLQTEVLMLHQVLSEKQEQEKAMVQVMMRIEQEQKITEDARRFAEQDAEAQRHIASALQEKHDNAMEKLAAMEKRAVMAETMLEATLQYEAGQPGSGGVRRASKEEESSKWWSLSSPRNSADASSKPKSEPMSRLAEGQQEEANRKQGLFSRINWRERVKQKSDTPPPTLPMETEEKKVAAADVVVTENGGDEEVSAAAANISIQE